MKRIVTPQQELQVNHLTNYGSERRSQRAKLAAVGVNKHNLLIFFFESCSPLKFLFISDVVTPPSALEMLTQKISRNQQTSALLEIITAHQGILKSAFVELHRSAESMPISAKPQEWIAQCFQHCIGFSNS